MKYLRMSHYLLVSAALYAMALLVEQPQLQIILWKTGHITVAAFAGYWIDKAVFRDELDGKSLPMRQMRRAVIIASAMLAVSMGL